MEFFSSARQLLYKSCLLESAFLSSVNQLSHPLPGYLFSASQGVLIYAFGLHQPSHHSGPSWLFWSIFQLPFLHLTDFLYIHNLKSPKARILFGQGFLCYDTLKTAVW